MRDNTQGAHRMSCSSDATGTEEELSHQHFIRFRGFMYYDAFVTLNAKATELAHKGFVSLVYCVSFVWFLALYAYLETRKPQHVLTALYTDLALEAKADLMAFTKQELKELLALNGIKAPSRANKAELVNLLAQGV